MQRVSGSAHTARAAAATQARAHASQRCVCAVTRLRRCALRPPRLRRLGRRGGRGAPRCPGPPPGAACGCTTDTRPPLRAAGARSGSAGQRNAASEADSALRRTLGAQRVRRAQHKAARACFLLGRPGGRSKRARDFGHHVDGARLRDATAAAAHCKVVVSSAWEAVCAATRARAPHARSSSWPRPGSGARSWRRRCVTKRDAASRVLFFAASQL